MLVAINVDANDSSSINDFTDNKDNELLVLNNLVVCKSA